MKIYFYMRRNEITKSGLSFKMWKIERKDRIVTTWWGPAIIKNRIPRPSHNLQSKKRKFRTEDQAIKFEHDRIQSKLRKGYERKPKYKT